MSQDPDFHKIKNIRLERLPSKTYRLSWTTEGKDKEVFFTTKASIVKSVNSHKTIKELREFLSQELKTGAVIK